MVAALLCIAPITIRNDVKFHDFVLVTADYGKVFFHGNARGADGFNSAFLADQDVDPSGNHEPDYAHVFFRKVASEQAGRPLRPSEAARFWFMFTLREILSRPWPHVVLEFKKLHLFFHAYEMHLVGSAFWEYQAIGKTIWVRFEFISACALIGMTLVILHRRFTPYFLFYSSIFTYLLSCLIFLVTSRYRGPAVPYLCLFAGYAIVSTFHCFRERRYRSGLISVLAFTILFLLNTLPYRQDIDTLETSMHRIFRDGLQHRTFTHPDVEVSPQEDTP